MALINPETEKFVWKKTYGRDSGFQVLHADDEIVVVKTRPTLLSKSADGLIAYNMATGKRTQVPAGFVPKKSDMLMVAESQGASLSYAELALLTVSALGDAIKKYKDSYRNDRMWDARTMIPRSENYLMMSYDSLACWDQDDKLVWELKGTIQAALPKPGKKSTVLGPKSTPPAIDLLGTSGDMLYLVVTGNREKVFYAVDKNTGECTYYQRGFPVFFKANNLMYMMFDAKGNPGKAGNLKKTVESGGTKSVTVLFGAGPIEGKVVKAFAIDPASEVDTGKAIPLTTAGGGGKRKRSGMRWYYNKIYTGGGSMLTYMADFNFAKQHLALALGAGIARGAAEEFTMAIFIPVSFSWYIFGAKKMFTPSIILGGGLGFEESYEGFLLGAELGLQMKKNKLRFFAELMFYIGAQTHFLDGGGEDGGVTPLYRDNNNGGGDTPREIDDIFAIRPAIGIKF